MQSPYSKGFRTRCWLAQALGVVLVLTPNLSALEAADPQQKDKPMAPLPTVRSLKVIPLAGNGEMNDLELRVMAPLVVQVLDQNDRPVEGADVIFRFPLSGPSATFANQKNSETIKTNADGQAAAVGWTANSQSGSFQIHVTASRGNEVGDTIITMRNVPKIVEEVKRKHKSFWSSRWTKIAVIAGAAGAVTGIVLATRGGSSTSGNNVPVTASPGPPTIGGPR